MKQTCKVQHSTLEKMKKLATYLRENGEVSIGEAGRLLGMNPPAFRSFLTSMTQFYLIYEYDEKKSNMVYIGILK